MSNSIVSAKERKALNTKLHKLLKPTYFDEIPLQDIFNLLDESGFVMLQEDMTKWSGFLCGNNIETLFYIGRNQPVKVRSGINFFEQIDNTGLRLTWYKMSSGRYEVIGYFV